MIMSARAPVVRTIAEELRGAEWMSAAAESGLSAPGRTAERSGHSFPGGNRPSPAQNGLTMGTAGWLPLSETHSRLSGLEIDFGHMFWNVQPIDLTGPRGRSESLDF